jgi:hypothetical protein
LKLKPIVTIICLTIGGCFAMYLKNDALAGTCFGAIAMWGFVNGVKNEIKKANEEAEG